MRMSYEVLYTILDKKEADKVCRMLKGATITFPKVKIEHKDIRNDFNRFVDMGLSKWEAIEKLSNIYEKDKTQIWRIVKDNSAKDSK